MVDQPPKKIFIFLDTEKHASAFDILLTIDILPGAEILKYEDVTAEDAERIVYDAMFPRGPEGAKDTKIFINGRDIRRVNDILERVKKCMFTPFELAVLIDPRGAYTTAAAATAKTLELLEARGLGGYENKTVTMLAGTGAVGQTAARLYASEGATVIVTSRELSKASSVAMEINKEMKGEAVRGVEAQTPEEVGKSIANSEIVFAAGAAGTPLLSLEVLRKYGGRCRIVADVNAIPPFGIEGLESEAEGKELLPDVLGIGALAIGRLKNRIEKALIAKVAEERKGFFDYRTGYDIAKKTIAKLAKKRASEREPQKFWIP